MRIGRLCLLFVLMSCLLAGCSSKQEESSPTPSAPINNNAPEARNAPPAPGPGPDVPRPGGKMRK
jgi:nitrous oxide reductase accessory protein NosL